MKKSIKILAAILATLMLVSFIPLAAFAEEIETGAENTENETAETLEEGSSESVEATSESEIPSDTENEETETMVFEFIEPEMPGKSRLKDPTMEDFGPSDGDTSSDYTQITSAVVPDGVYSLKNLGNAGLWMDIEQSKTDAGYHVQQYAYPINPASTSLFDRAGLFKISRKSNGLYVIRLMLNNRLSFGFVGDEVITKEIKVVDAAVPDTDCFTITCENGNYIIKPYGSPYAISAKNSTASGLSGAPDSYLAKRTASEAGSRAKWQMYKYTGAQRSSTTIYYPSSWENKGIPVGATGTMHNKTWSTYVGANTPKMCVESGYEDLMTYEWNEDSLKTSFEALSPGKVSVKSQIFVGNTTTVQHTSDDFYFQVIPKEGYYSIANKKTTNSVYIEAPEENGGTLVHQHSYMPIESQVWLIEHVADGEGFVRIRASDADKYIGVDPTEQTLVRLTDTQNDYTLWKFERTSSGNLKLICKAVSTTLALTSPSNLENANLTVSAYTDNSDYNDEWSIYPVQYIFALDHHYDYGYDARYTDNYQTAEQKIVSYHNAVAERLMQIFGVIVFNYNCEKFVSSADYCKWQMYGDDYLDHIWFAENCYHGTAEDLNIHLERTPIQAPFPYNDNLTPVAWTGYIMPGPKTSVTIGKHSIVMTPYNMTDLDSVTSEYVNESNSSVRIDTINELLHEIAHTLSAPDHYCKVVGGVCLNNNYCNTAAHNEIEKNRRPGWCIMDNDGNNNIQKWLDIDLRKNDEIFCDCCYNEIIAHLEEHHRIGGN